MKKIITIIIILATVSSCVSHRRAGTMDGKTFYDREGNEYVADFVGSDMYILKRRYKDTYHYIPISRYEKYVVKRERRYYKGKR